MSSGREQIDRFDQLGLSDALMRWIAEAGYEVPSHIQSVCIPPLIAGRNIVAHTDTGTGKTLAFVLPLLHRLELAGRHTQVLVLTPSDDTSLHVAETFQDCGKYLSDFHVLPIYHLSAMIQLRQLQRGAHVIVGTPRRVIHYLQEGAISLGALKAIVLDEADRLFQSGFMGDVRSILELAPGTPQIALFAATLPKGLFPFLRQYLRKSQTLDGIERITDVPPIRQRHWRVDEAFKLSALTRLVEVEPDFDAGLVFVQHRAAAAALAEKLRARGYAAAALDSDIPAELRSQIVDQFYQRELDIIICTELAADELDVVRVTHVISYDLPCDVSSYVHRIGHVGRLGRRTTSILFVTPRELGMLHSIERAIHHAIPMLELPERFR